MPATSASGSTSTERASSASAPTSANVQRREPGDAPGLRERDRVGEVDEQPRHLGQQQDREAAARARTSPSGGGATRPANGSSNERRDGDRAAPAEHLGREPVVVGVRDDELVAVVRERAQALGRARVVRDRLVDDRLQPEQRRARSARARRRAAAPSAATRRHAAARRAPSGSSTKSAYVGCVSASAPKIAAASQAAVREEERDRRRHQQLARGRAGQRQRRPRAAVARAEAEDREREREQRDAGRARAEDGDARLVGDGAARSARAATARAARRPRGRRPRTTRRARAARARAGTRSRDAGRRP